MSRLPILASLALAAALGACATEPPSGGLKLAAAPAAAPPAIPPDASSYGLFLAGREAMDDGRAGAAADYYAKATLAEGGDSYLKERTFSAALLAGDIPTAAQYVAEGDDADPAAHRLGVLVRGVEAFAEGRNKDAEALLTSADIGYPHKDAAALLAPWAAVAAGDMKVAVTKQSLPGDPVAQFFADLDQAMLLERAHQFDEAESSYKILLSQGAATGLVSADYGAFLERRGRWADALAVYSAALAVSPGDRVLTAGRDAAVSRRHAPAMKPIRQAAAQALVAPAANLLAQRQSDVSLAYLRLALRLDPDQDEAWVLVGDILQSDGNIDGARDAYSHAKPGSEQFVAAHVKLAWTYQTAGDTDTALKLARETVAAAPASRDATVNLADLLRAADHYDEAAQVLNPLIASEAGHPDWRLLYLRAMNYDESDQWPKAEQDLQAALKLRPDEPELLNFLGYCWIDRGEHLQQALAMVQKAVDANPQSGAMLDSLGWGYYKLGDYKTAVAKLEDAVLLEPADADVNNHLGDAYWRDGRKTEAAFQWRRVLSLDPDPKTRADTEAKLKDGLDAVPAPPAADDSPAKVAAATAAPAPAP